MARSDTTTTAELYVRSLAPSYEFQSQERVLSLLDELVSRGRLAGYDVFVWGDAICPDGTGAHTPTGRWVLDRVERIERWAVDSGSAIAALRSDEHRSAITGECRAVTHLPSLALAEFDGDDLVHFAPCLAAGEHVTVLRRLGSLASAPLGKRAATDSEDGDDGADRPVAEKSSRL
ncbi:HTH domain-containing protein [Halomarina litorea]|uniref:HTH domain-containing protein n=1 Tax=Halomarina litorea TaxID=2961595 RepID=UPI0020C4DEE4|nr:HTH domain-containing protein [Halomarina sp. BCD28]